MGSQSTPPALRRLCVFCGSSPGARPAYGEAAEELGRLLVAEGIGLVYGGGKVGLMGRLADTVLAEGGEAIGVLPEALVAKEIGHPGLDDLRVVGSMHERKALMAELSDGFVALPAGWAPWRSCSRCTPGRSSASTASRARCSTWRVITRAWRASWPTPCRSGSCARTIGTCWSWSVSLARCSRG